MIKTLVTIRRTRSWENQSWKDNFLLHGESVFTEEEVEIKFRSLVKDFLETPEGKKAIEETSYDFNWGDVMMYISESFWNERGFSPLYKDGTFHASGLVSLDFEQDEVLCGIQDGI